MLITENEKAEQPQEQSLKEILTEFFDVQSAKDYEKDLWHWYMTALDSEEVDGWTNLECSNLAFLYQLLTELIEKLEIIHLKTQK